LADEERQVLASLVAQLRLLLTDGEDDPGLRRLFPTAYADDVERENEYQSLVHDDLRARRLAALDLVASTLDAPVLDEDQLVGWMGALNDLRLVLGTKLDVSEETDIADVDPADPDAPALAVYGWLGWLLEQVVDALQRR
jgi:hypothetical protein